MSNYVSFYRNELEQLFKNHVIFYTDYLDQGFMEVMLIEDDDSIKNNYKDEIYFRVFDK
jgi:hypothetical protein